MVTACDYNQQLSVSGRIDIAIVTPNLLHSKVRDLPMVQVSVLITAASKSVSWLQNSLLSCGCACAQAVDFLVWVLVSGSEQSCSVAVSCSLNARAS